MCIGTSTCAGSLSSTHSYAKLDKVISVPEHQGDHLQRYALDRLVDSPRNHKLPDLHVSLICLLFLTLVSMLWARLDLDSIALGSCVCQWRMWDISYVPQHVPRHPSGGGLYRTWRMQRLYGKDAPPATQMGAVGGGRSLQVARRGLV